MTKEQAMHKYKIDDLREFDTNDFIKVMSALDKIDPEVAKELIAQIPNFLTHATESLNIIKESYEATIKEDSESLKSVYQSYDLIIETLNTAMKDGELSIDEKIAISNLIRDLIKDKQEAHFLNQKKRHELYKDVATKILIATTAIVGALSGLSMIKKSGELPTHDDSDDNF